MTKLSERIAVLQQALLEHGDVEVFCVGSDNDVGDNFEPIEVARRIDGRLVYESEYFQQLKYHSNAEQQQHIRSLCRQQKIIGAWPTAEVVLII